MTDKISEIFTGFLAGDLVPALVEENRSINWDQSIPLYAKLCTTALKERYGQDVEVTVRWQDGGGVRPHGLKTTVMYEDGTGNGPGSNISQKIDILLGEVWQDWKWVIYNDN